MRAAFDATCDSFSLVTITGSYARYSALNSGVLVGTSSLGFSSSSVAGGLKLYLSPDGNAVFPTWTVIISVVSGNIVLVSFDEGCSLCGQHSSACSANSLSAQPGQTSCFVPRADCKDLAQSQASGGGSGGGGGGVTGNSCDLRVFFVWSGDAADGSAFQSSAKRPSRFSAWPLQATQLWDSLKSLGSHALPST